MNPTNYTREETDLEMNENETTKTVKNVNNTKVKSISN